MIKSQSLFQRLAFLFVANEKGSLQKGGRSDLILKQGKDLEV
ncbi:hypothetical protein MADA3029_900086 [Vibrio nigripulchritudo MADA3029]|nr:hypothetical protein VIBNIMADA3020_1040049 [Vibrio nigripulchritudo MADA3020]CCN51777.1 hypothetical protein VIBNIMADA3021_1160085 [Vibrio nigripulchritudo MADA3021]CCN61941.1 hypothetical protein MADA3029_900086 [Vibrio nigripulchritudo MADA3029]